MGLLLILGTAIGWEILARRKGWRYISDTARDVPLDVFLGAWIGLTVHFLRGRSAEKGQRG